MEYFNQIKSRRRSSQISKSSNPVLTAEDEAYLRQLTAQPQNVPESSEQKDAPTQATEHLAESSQQPAVNESSQEAQNVPLPTSPVEEFGKELGEEERKAQENPEGIEKTESETPKTETAVAPEKKKKRWSAMFWKKHTDSEKVHAPCPMAATSGSEY